MKDIVQNLPVYMLVGIVAIVVISQFNRVVGSALGIAFWLAVAVVGSTAYDSEGALGIGGMRFTKPTFFAVCGFFALINVLFLFLGLKNRKRTRTTLPEE